MAFHTTGSTNVNIQLSDNAALTLPDADWTVAGWFRLISEVSTFPHIIAWNTLGGDPSFNFWHDSANDDGSIWLEDADGDSVVNTVDFIPNLSGTTDWQHIAITRTGAGVITGYLDGVAQGTGTDSALDAIDHSGAWIFGTKSDGTKPTDSDFAEWAKWDRALSVGEIVGLAKGFTPDHYLRSIGWYVPMVRELRESIHGITVTNHASVTVVSHPPVIKRHRRTIFVPAAAGGGGRIMSSLAAGGGLAGMGGIAGAGGGLAG